MQSIGFLTEPLPNTTLNVFASSLSSSIQFANSRIVSSFTAIHQKFTPGTSLLETQWVSRAYDLYGLHRKAQLYRNFSTAECLH